MKVIAFDKDKLKLVGKAINPHSYTIISKQIGNITLYELVFCLTTYPALRSQLLAELAKHNWGFLKVEL
jgi:hypothetical protein